MVFLIFGPSFCVFLAFRRQLVILPMMAMFWAKFVKIFQLWMLGGDPLFADSAQDLTITLFPPTPSLP